MNTCIYSPALLNALNKQSQLNDGNIFLTLCCKAEKLGYFMISEWKQNELHVTKNTHVKDSYCGKMIYPGYQNILLFSITVTL